jgi:hypothetical protein
MATISGKTTGISGKCRPEVFRFLIIAAIYAKTLTVISLPARQKTVSFLNYDRCLLP